MPVRKPARTGSTNGGQRRTAPAKQAAPARKPAARKPAPAPAPEKKRPGRVAQGLSQYASKEPTDFHKAFATWLVKEVGFSLKSVDTVRDAFLMGVSLATVTRNTFQASDWLAEWRERTGNVKPGPRASRDADEADDEDGYEDDSEEEEGYEDDEDDSEEDDDSDDDSGFEDDSDEDEDADDSEEDDDSGWEDDAEEEAPAPAPKPRARKTAPAASGTRTKATAPAGKSTASRARTATKPSTRGSAPATKARRVARPDDGTILF